MVTQILNEQPHIESVNACLHGLPYQPKGKRISFIDLCKKPAAATAALAGFFFHYSIFMLVTCVCFVFLAIFSIRLMELYSFFNSNATTKWTKRQTELAHKNIGVHCRHTSMLNLSCYIRNKHINTFTEKEIAVGVGEWMRREWCTQMHPCCCLIFMSNM